MTRRMLFVCCGVAGIAVSIPNPLVFDLQSRIYPWNASLLVVLLFAVTLIGFARAGIGHQSACGVAIVLAAQLAGLGIVAIKHWEPVMGMSGSFGHLGTLRGLAALLALAGISAVAVCLRELLHDGAIRWPSLRTLPVAAAGILLAVALPWVIAGGDPAMSDVTSLGAMGLLYSLPFGLGLILASTLPRVPALATGLAVTASIALALIGSPMQGILFTDPHSAFVVALVVATAATVALALFGSARGADQRASADIEPAQ